MIKEIEGTNLVAIKVAPDACNYKFGKWIFGEKIHPKDLFYDTEENIWNVGNEILPKGDYKILGEVTKDKIGFDVRLFADKYNDGSYRDYINTKSFCPDNNTIDIFLTKEGSFYSRLASNGIYFENPIKNELIHDDYSLQNIAGLNNTEKKKKVWQSYEDRIVEKLLIIEKIK